MRFSLFKQYGAKNSEPVFDAFEHSLRQAGHTIEHDSMHSDVAVIWSVLFNGRMSSNTPIYEYYTRTGKKVIVLEVGGIKRGTTWKVGLNGINRDAFWGDTGNDDSRARSLGLGLKPWRKDGEYILICGQHDKSLQWRNMPSMSQWIIDTIETIQKHSKRPIIFRPHPRCPLPHIEHEFKNVKRQEPRHLEGTYDDFDMAFDNVFATVGIHPHDAKDVSSDYIIQLEDLSKHEKVVAIGEIGIDTFRNLSPINIQKRVMIEQMELAATQNLPIVFHNRDADNDILDILTRHKFYKALAHCYSSNLLFAKKLISLDILLSFSGNVTFKNATNIEAETIIKIKSNSLFFIYIT